MFGVLRRSSSSTAFIATPNMTHRCPSTTPFDPRGVPY
jgi:hypothetical protein